MFGAVEVVCQTCLSSYHATGFIGYECPACANARILDSVERDEPYCTVTGADNSTDLEALWKLARQYPFVEFGILYSQDRQGVGRYPSFEWIDSLVERMAKCNPPNFALHICGSAVHDFLAGEGHVARIAHRFPRIQLNLREEKHDIQDLRAALDRYFWQTIITQMNGANASLWRKLSDKRNHAVLFDESGGTGKARAEWPGPLSITHEGLPFEAIDPLCGYAGGIGPDNIDEILPQVDAAAAGRKYWIDMEGKLRDDEDRFDLHKVEQVLNACQHFLNPQLHALVAHAHAFVIESMPADETEVA